MQRSFASLRMTIGTYAAEQLDMTLAAAFLRDYGYAID